MTLRLSDRMKQRLGHHLAPRPKPSFHDALNFIVSTIQRSTFPELFGKEMPQRCRFSSLSPFKDDDIVRVGGRLLLSDLEYQNKFPVLLPSKYPFTNVLIRHYHDLAKHQGCSITLSSIRENGFFIHRASETI